MEKTLHDDYRNVDKLFKEQLIKTKVSFVCLYLWDES
jgi:hypothetical protein